MKNSKSNGVSKGERAQFSNDKSCALKKSSLKKCREECLRKLNREDLPAVVRIEQESFAKPLTPRQIGELLANPHSKAIGCERDGKLLGFLLFAVLDQSIFVADLAVAKTDRRGGVATRLLSWLVSRLKQFRRERIWLRVEIQNKAAIACYLSQGFQRREDILDIVAGLSDSERRLIDMEFVPENHLV